MPTCKHCGDAYEERQSYPIHGAQTAPPGCRSCVRLCACGGFFIVTAEERAIQDAAICRYRERMKRGIRGAIPDTLPRKCEACRPVAKVRAGKGARVLAMEGRR